MSKPPFFENSYIAFTAAAEPFVRADDVGFAVSEFMWFDGRPFYPIGALTEANVVPARLSAGFFEDFDEDNLDLIFRMRESDGGSFFEIVLRSDQGTAYGGWAWGRDLTILSEFVDGHRVLATTCAEERIRFIFCKRVMRYRAETGAPVNKTALTQSRLALVHC